MIGVGQRNPMKPYESEIRLFVPNIKVLNKKLKQLNSKRIGSYSFFDHCYKPVDASKAEWDPNRKVMRIREWARPEKYSQIIFSKTEIVKERGICFKKTVYPQGKIELFRGSKEMAEDLLKHWGFEYWFTVKKLSGVLYKILKPLKFTVAIENVGGLGCFAEVEIHGQDVEEIAEKMIKILKILEIPLNLTTSKSMPRLVAEKLGRL